MLTRQMIEQMQFISPALMRVSWSATVCWWNCRAWRLLDLRSSPVIGRSGHLQVREFAFVTANYPFHPAFSDFGFVRVVEEALKFLPAHQLHPCLLRLGRPVDVICGGHN